MKYRLERDQFHRWVKNAVKFTAPALAVFFLQLAGGVEFRFAIGVALLAFWGLLADYFKKLGEKMSNINIGLSEDSTEKEKIVIQDENTAVKYFVQEESIDLEALRREREMLEQILNIPKPSDEELIEIGKMQHPYFQERTHIQTRINEINKILGE